MTPDELRAWLDGVRERLGTVSAELWRPPEAKHATNDCACRLCRCDRTLQKIMRELEAVVNTLS